MQPSTKKKRKKKERGHSLSPPTPTLSTIAPRRSRPAKFLIEDNTDSTISSRHSSPATESRLVDCGVVPMSSDTDNDVTPAPFNTPTSPPTTTSIIEISTTNPSPVDTSVYATPTAAPLTDNFFPATIPNPFNSFPTTSTITTSVCTIASFTTTTSTLSLTDTIVHSTPNTSIIPNNVQQKIQSNPSPSPIKTNKKKVILNDYDDISAADKILTLSSSRPKRQPSPTKLMDTIVSPPPSPGTTPSDAHQPFEPAYTRSPPTLFPQVIVLDPSDSELSPASQFISAPRNKRKRNPKSNSTDSPQIPPPTPPPPLLLQKKTNTKQTD